MEGAADSKRMSAAARERVFPEVFHVASAVAIGAASVREIDRLNVLEATALAMRRALDRLPIDPDHVVLGFAGRTITLSTAVSAIGLSPPLNVMSTFS